MAASSEVDLTPVCICVVNCGFEKARELVQSKAVVPAYLRDARDDYQVGKDHDPQVAAAETDASADHDVDGLRLPHSVDAGPSRG